MSSKSARNLRRKRDEADVAARGPAGKAIEELCVGHENACGWVNAAFGV